LPGHSLRVRLTNGEVLDERCGLSQGGISIVGDVTYAGYVWVKVADQRGYKGQITVALEEDETDGETYDRAALPVTGQGGWHQYSFRLSATKTNRLAKFTILFEGAGTLYLDQVSLMPANTTNNIRDDSAQMIASLGPSFIRWPGGNVAQDYHWQWGIGPRDLRPIWTNRAWSDAPEPNDLGTDEYLALCARVHAQPSITVNVNGAGATPEEAAAWVEYVNGPSSSHYGALRAANGHPDPYSVRYWELGNEIYGDWVRGHTDAKIYAQNALEYAHAMRAVDPAIQLIVVGAGDNWNTRMLNTVGRKIDYLAIHDYTAMSQNAKGADTRAQMMERAGEFEANYRHIGELITRLVPGHRIKLIVNEWNLFYPVEVIQSMDGAVYASRMMDGFERAGDVVEANAISDLLNGWIGGVIQVSRDRLYGTPQFHAIKLYRDHLGTERLHAVIESPDLAPGVKSLDAVVTRSSDSQKIFIKMSNADLQHAERVAIVFDNFRYAAEVKQTMLSSADPSLRNTFAQPDVVKPVETVLRCLGQCTCLLPPDSIVVLTFDKESKQEESRSHAPFQ
jgi:alpha-N-arabinofuranosidase